MAVGIFNHALTMTSATAWSDRNPSKEQLRQRIWQMLQDQGAVKRDPFGHIPSFIGAEAAAIRLAQLPIWQQAQVIKCNPDSPQEPVRLRALAEGKILYMAVPRLTQLNCFVEVTAAALNAQQLPLQAGASMAGALRHGKPIRFEQMRAIDLVLVGCVAATSAGGRTGKGAGFADLELAMLREFGLVQSETPIATTIHGLQQVPEPLLEMQAHDWPLDWVITPDAAIATHTTLPRPTGLDWPTIQADQFADIPILRWLQQTNAGQTSLERQV